MSLIESVFEASNYFMKDPKFVKVNYDKCKEISNELKKSYEGEPQFSSWTEDELFVVLIANAMNYCFWYGTSQFRPENSSSNKMYEIIERCVKRVGVILIDSAIQDIIECLAIARFPLLEERVKHIKEVGEFGKDFIRVLSDNIPDSQGEHLFSYLVRFFPGYGSDIFLKRASLFFLELYRRFGLFPTLVKKLHVPADYQVPKMLNYFDCIKYTPLLQELINHDVLIPKFSLPECEIRSATILACDYIVKESNTDISFVDWYFWSRRNECKNEKFHLTITTDY